MAVEHDFGDKPTPVIYEESGTFNEEMLLKIMEQMPKQQPIVWGRRQGFYQLGVDFGFKKGVNTFIQEYPDTPEGAAKATGSPTITFRHGDVEKSITLTEADLKPQNAFKLNQKIGAMIKSAYNTKTKGVKNGNATRHHRKTG